MGRRTPTQSSNGATLRACLDFFQLSLPDPAGLQYNVDLCQIAYLFQGYSRSAGYGLQLPRGAAQERFLKRRGDSHAIASDL